MTKYKPTTGEASPSYRHRGGEEGIYIPVDVTKSVDGYLDLRREIQARLASVSLYLCISVSLCLCLRVLSVCLLKDSHAQRRN